MRGQKLPTQPALLMLTALLMPRCGRAPARRLRLRRQVRSK